MKAKLVDKLLEAVEVPPGRKAVRVWDSALPGFHARVLASGVVTFYASYGTGRRGQGRHYKIGRWRQPWTCESARKRAKSVLGRATDAKPGQDPAARRQHERGLPTLAEYSVTYIREIAAKDKRLSSCYADVGNLGRILFRDDATGREAAKAFRRGLWSDVCSLHPEAATATLVPVADPKARKFDGFGAGLSDIGRKRIDLVDAQDVRRFHASRRQAPTGANRCLALLSDLFSKAEIEGKREAGSNPCVHVARYEETERERYLSEVELARLGEALAEVEAAGNESPFALAAIRLLVFTGCRRAEILTLRWEHVDLERCVLTLPQTKEKKHKKRPKAVMLNAPARAVLAALPRLEGNPYVIAGRRAGAHLVGLEHIWQRIREAADLRDVRLHDLRHSFASVAVAGGATLPVIGALLGHSQPQTTARYAHLSDNPLRAASEAVGGRIAAAMQPKPEAGATVEPLRRGRVR